MLKDSRIPYLVLLGSIAAVPMFAKAERGPIQGQNQNSREVMAQSPSLQQSKSQERTVTGTVVDEKGEPIIGATVREKGKTSGTVTDLDGNFSLQLTTGQEITVSYVGFATQDISVAGKNSLKVTLKEDKLSLSEIVVVGYGSSTKRDLIASVSTVDAKEMTNVPVANIAQGLAGRSPGLIVKANGGGYKLCSGH